MLFFDVVADVVQYTVLFKVVADKATAGINDIAVFVRDAVLPAISCQIVTVCFEFVTDAVLGAVHGFTAGYGSIGNSLLHEVVDVSDRKADAGRIPNVREWNRAECNATMLIDINGQNGILACFRKRPLCFVQLVGAVDDIAYLAARTFETVKSGCIAVIFAWVFDVRVTAYFEAQVVFEGDFSVIVNGHLKPSFLINAKRRTSQKSGSPP